ncbi:hypothetical protein BN961_00285 [Afipia felis]|uniref:Uncharacterized protein n=1 Tax=Afipia felis TaxID=1035 RepID=A0A090MKU7_AFIFE|nr:hypothetical protein BN961_00285 [Afipia felis]
MLSGREGEAFRGRASVAQALAGADMTALAEACIEQCLARGDVRGALGADRERGGISEGGSGFPNSSHGTSVPTPMDLRSTACCQQIVCDGMDAGEPASG